MEVDVMCVVSVCAYCFDILYSMFIFAVFFLQKFFGTCLCKYIIACPYVYIFVYVDFFFCLRKHFFLAFFFC